MKIKIFIFLSFLAVSFISLLLLSGFSIADSATVTSTATTVWWNDSVTISGNATYSNGSVRYPDTVNITVGNVKCNNNTQTNGGYFCTFKAPLELGIYNVSINITNSTGNSILNHTTLTVKAKYGETPIGNVPRAVYETPLIMQEPSGRIRIVFIRIMAWRGV